MRKSIPAKWIALLGVSLLTPLLPPVAAQDGNAIAIINGEPLPKEELVKLLMDSHGLEALQQLIVLRLARDEARRRGLHVTPDDIEAEFKSALAMIAPDANFGDQKVSDEDRRKALEGLLQQKGLSMAEFTIAMERNACLRKIVEQDLKFDEKVLREEFARTYGEKVEVRHIQSADQQVIQKAIDELARGADFGELARKYSENEVSAPNGGLLEPFAFTEETMTPVLRDAAFALAPGELSPIIKAGTRYHILKLERRIPPENANFENVRAQIEQTLRSRIFPVKRNELVMDLVKKAQVKVLDAKLKKEYDELLKKDDMPATP